MVMITQAICHSCASVTIHHDRQCVECEELRARERMAVWAAKTTDQKIAELRERIEALERGPTQY